MSYKRACLDVFNDYTWDEVCDQAPPSVQEAWKLGQTVFIENQEKVRDKTELHDCPFCGGSKHTPFIKRHVPQECFECNEDGKVTRGYLKEKDLL